MPFDTPQFITRYQPQEEDEILQTILNAEQNILEKGWCKGEYVSEEGAVCLLGAFGWTMYEENINEKSLRYVGTAVFGSMSDEIYSCCDIAEWNDADERDLKEVLAALRNAAEKRRQELNK